MVIEFLYPEITTAIGDHGNFLFLHKAFEKHEIICTHVLQKPAFAARKVDFIYMGAMAQESKKVVINQLTPYKTELLRQIKNNTTLLFTHEAFEVLCEKIILDDKTELRGLGFYPFYAVTDLMHRIGQKFVGTPLDLEADETQMKILGFRSQFTKLYGVGPEAAIFKAESGMGSNEQSAFEGFRDHNLFATYLVGPFLHYNPAYAQHIFRTLPEELAIPYAEDLHKAYAEHLKIMQDKRFTIH